MLPNSPIVVIIFLIIDAIKGMAIGAFSGWVASLVTKCKPLRVWRDSLLGSLGFIAGFIGIIYMPWHENTITYKLSNGVTVTSTMNSYQHPERVAIAVAVILPVLYELFRWMRARKSQARPRPTNGAAASNGET